VSEKARQQGHQVKVIKPGFHNPAVGCLIGGFVIAGGAAGFAVHETVLANADLEYGLAEAAELIALALLFGHFTLGALVFGSGGHSRMLAPGGERENVPLVTWGVARSCA
jgi:hypothetical protein